MVETDAVRRQLAEGAHRSLQACSPVSHASLPVVVWRRHKWTIIGFLLFLFVELIGLGSLGSGMNHF